jgi:hypothetical protein
MTSLCAWRTASGLTLVLAFLLAGCAAPQPQAEQYNGTFKGTAKASNDLSGARMEEIGEALIGKELVFRVTWHEYADVDPDPDLRSPCPLKAITSSAAGMAVQVPAGSAERGQLVVAALPGETATINGIQFLRDRMLLFSQKPNGSPVFLSVLMPRGRTVMSTKTTSCGTRQTISDENLTAAWLENALTQTVGELVAPTRPAVALPAAKKGLVLTPPEQSSAAVAAARPAVALLTAHTEPGRVKRGDVVRLSMAYSVTTQGGQQLQVDESYELSFADKPLPGFPVRRTASRTAGEHRGDYNLQTPNGAAPGTYRFKAEVCFEGRCSSMVSTFEIVP